MKGLLTVLLLTMSLKTFAFILGQREGGGGVVIAAEFASVGRTAIEILGMGDDSLDVKSIFKAIKSTKIIPVKDICDQDPNNGELFCQDAHYNSIDNEIKFNYQKWNNFDCRSKMTLAAHEYLRVAGLETEDYQFSGRFLTGNLVREGHKPELFAYLSSKCQDIPRE